MDFLPPYGTFASLYLRPTLIGVNPQLGVNSSKECMFMMLCSNLFTSLLNFRRMLVVTGTRPDWLGWVVKPALSMVGAWMGYRALAAALPQPDSLVALLLWGGAVVTAAYLLLVWASGCLSGEVLLTGEKGPAAGQRKG